MNNNNNNRLRIIILLIVKIIIISQQKIQINDKKWFIDEHKRVKLFHGINAVSKEYPWLPSTGHLNLYNETQLNYIQEWGFNVVRLGLMWSGLQPNKDVINRTYLEEIKKIVNKLAQRDIYTIIDFHQDFMSTSFNSYDGFPQWFMQLVPQSSFDYPWPFKKKDIGFAAYLTESCGQAFQALYDNTNNLQSYLIDYWTIVSKEFVNNSYILGYELVNEPWAGNVYRNPQLLFPARAGKLNLLPLYDNLYENIRKYDNETLVFYEPVTWGVMSSDRYLFGTGFNRAPAHDNQKTVLAWHHYCWLLQFNENPLQNDKLPGFDRLLCDDIQKKKTFKSIDETKRHLGSASFLTEFGVCAFTRSDGTQDTSECEEILNSADAHFESWTYWDSDFYTYEDFQINKNLLNAFSRVYPMSTSGTPMSLYFNCKSKLFVYKFVQDKSIEQPSEIFIPKHTYSHGFMVHTSNNLKWHYSNQIVYLHNLHEVESDDAFVKIISNFDYV